ncbi:30S ribosomal protein S9 [bacterium]|nr:MAG: 30S ribosomal protein S9 [bacterium]
MATNTPIYVGRRKTSVARVYLTSGSGKITINEKTAENYFKSSALVETVKIPLIVTDTFSTYDVHVNVNGGGIVSQVGAVTLGIARALLAFNVDHRIALKGKGLLTRDPRMVERKKYGQPKARKRFQFSKR